MSQREKIMIGILVAAAIGAGAYYFFFDTKQQSVEQMVNMTELETAVTQVTTLTQANTLNDSELGKLRMAETPWQADPFYKYVEGERTATINTDTRDQFRYTGYVNLGGIALAIINGWEYGVDDQLEEGNYVVVSIEEEKVILGQRDDKNEIAGLIEVELEADELNLFD